MTMEQAIFIVAVMDSLTQWPQLLPGPIATERKKLDVMYQEFGRFSEAANLARAKWLIEHTQSLEAQR